MIVAAVQMDAEPFRVERNLRTAGLLLDQAARRGAKLVVLPELFATGYTWSDRLFVAAEPLSGQVVSWMRDAARDRGLHVLGSVLESEGRRVYDTLAWCSPSGELLSHRKHAPVLFENVYFWKGERPTPLVDGAGLRLGPLIGGEIRKPRLWEPFRRSVDLVISSMAWPSAVGEGMTLPWFAPRFDAVPEQAPRDVARALATPLVFANPCGRFEGRLLPTRTVFRSVFLGGSGIFGADGAPLAMLERCEVGVAHADVPIFPRG